MKTMTTSKPANLLIIDDDEVDQMAVQRSFRHHRICNPTYTAKNGIEALQMLRGEAGREPIPRPFMILLDLYMPKMSGMEFLRELRSDPELRDSVVFVLSTSDQESDKQQAYDLNIAGYILKTRASEDFLKMVTMIEHFWRIVELPS